MVLSWVELIWVTSSWIDSSVQYYACYAMPRYDMAPDDTTWYDSKYAWKAEAEVEAGLGAEAGNFIQFKLVDELG